MVQIPRSAPSPIPDPQPRPAPQPGPDPQHEPERRPVISYAIVVCVGTMLNFPQHERPGLLQAIQVSEDPLPQDMLDIIQQATLTQEQKRSLFKRMVAYVFREPVGYLLNELLYQQRTVEAWRFWRNTQRYQPESVIFMVVTLAVLATHLNIDARHIIENFQPFVQHHIQEDQRLAPLHQMLRRPEEQRNLRNIWRKRILDAFIQLCENFCQIQASG
jgi:hypothetical protein